MAEAKNNTQVVPLVFSSEREAEAKQQTTDEPDMSFSPSSSSSVTVSFEDAVASHDAKAKQKLARKIKQEKKTRWRIVAALIIVSILEVAISTVFVVMAYSGNAQLASYRADSGAIGAALTSTSFWTGSFHFTCMTIIHTLAGDVWDVGFIVIVKAILIAFLNMIDLERRGVKNYLESRRRRQAEGYRRPTRAELRKRHESLCPAKTSLWWKLKFSSALLFCLVMIYVVFKCLIRMTTVTHPKPLDILPVANQWYWPVIATISISSLLQLRWIFAMLDATSKVAHRKYRMARDASNRGVHIPLLEGIESIYCRAQSSAFNLLISRRVCFYF